MTEKCQLSSKIHKALAWHEYATKGKYIAGGTLRRSDPFLLVAKRGRTRNEYWGRCAGSCGLRPLQEWHEERLCRNCLDRETPVCLSVPGSSSPTYYHPLNVACDQDIRITPATSTVIVPAGCPHATVREEGTQGMNGRVARFMRVLEKTYDAVPISWKITAHAGKYDLCIQYRRLFVEIPRHRDNAPKERSETLYCHITCNINNGTTFISDIHSNNKRLVTRRAFGESKLETLTYASNSVILSSIPGKDELYEPMREFYDSVKQALVEKFGDVSSPYTQSYDAKWKITDQAVVPSSPQEVLRAIAIMNRFPHLGFHPLTLRDLVPLYLKRRFDKLPREVKRDQIADLLHLPHSEILDALYEQSETAFEVVALLCEYGISDIALLDRLEETHEHTVIYHDSSGQEKSVNETRTNLVHAYKMLEAYIPFHSENNYVSLIYDNVDMTSLAVPITTALMLAGYDANTENDDHRTYHEQFVEKMLDAYKMDKVIATQFEKAIQRKFTKYKRKWETGFFVSTFNLVGTLPNHIDAFLAINEKRYIALGVNAKLYLDRRTWTRKNANRFFAMLTQWCAERREGYISPKTQKMYDEIAETLARAVRFSFSLDEYEASNDIQKTLSPQEQVNLIYMWATKSNVTITRRLEDAITCKNKKPLGTQARKRIASQKVRKTRAAKSKRSAHIDKSEAPTEKIMESE